MTEGVEAGSGHAAGDRRLPRVVAVGFNKCGTRSLGLLFERAGHRVVHHKFRDGLRTRRIGRLMKENIEAGRPVFSGAEDFDVYCDLVHSTPAGTWDGNAAFREILRDYPDTILLLNTRDREAWIASRLRHGHGEFARREMRARGLDDEAALTDAWRAEWDAHHAALRAHMADRPHQFVEFDLDRDPVEALIAAFPAHGLSAGDWGDTGRSRDVRRAPLVARAKRAWAHIRPRSER